MVLEAVDVGEADKPCTASCNLGVQRREAGVEQDMVVEQLLREI